jgi:hypothetical protein
LSRKRGASVEPAAAAGGAADAGADGAASVEATGKRGFNFNIGVSSLIPVTKTNSASHETKKIPSRSKSSEVTL